MGAFKNKNSNRYSIKISELNFDAPKVVKIKKNRKPAAVALILSLLAVFFIPATAYAETGNREITDTTCWLNEENTFAADLGGMTTAQFTASKDNVSPRKTDFANQPTIRDRYGEDISFLSWIPAVRNKTNANTEKQITTVIPNDLNWSDIGNPEWLSGSSTTIGPPSSTNPIRQGEYVKDSGLFLNEKWCEIAMIQPFTADVGPNILFNIAKGINNIATFLYVQASTGSNITDVFELNTDTRATTTDQLFKTSENTSWTKAFGDEVNKILTGDGTSTGKGLYDSLYLDFLLPVILIGTLVVLINAIRSRALRALNGIIWMIAAIVGGMLFLQKPMFIPQLIDGIVGTITESVNSAIIGDVPTPACEIPNVAPWTEEKEREAKEMECYIWYNTIYIPWVEGTYGVEYSSAIGNKTETSVLFSDPNGVLESTTISLGGDTTNTITLDPADSTSLGWPLYQLEYQDQPAAGNVARAQNALGENTEWFTDGGDKWGSAFLALTVSLASGIFIGINSTLIIAYQLTMLLLLLVAPLFLLIAVIPSQMGKGIGLRWAELVVGIAIKRSVIAIMLAIFLKMFIIISGIPNMAVGIQAILFGVLAVIGITQRKKIMEMFTGRVNFGGDKNINVGTGIESLGSKTAALAGGAALVATGAAMSRVKGSAKMAMVERRANKNEKALEAAETNEEKLAILKEQEAKADKKLTKQALRQGGTTVAAATRARLNREKSNVQFEVKEENITSIGDKLETVDENVSSVKRSVGYQGRKTREELAGAASEINANVESVNENIDINTEKINENVEEKTESVRRSVNTQGRKTRDEVSRSTNDINNNIDVSRESVRGSINNQGRKTRDEILNSKQDKLPPNNPPKRPPLK